MSFGTYITGSVGLLLSTAALGYLGYRLTDRLLPGWRGPAAWVSVIVLGVAGALLAGELLGSFGLYRGWIYLMAVLSVAVAARLWLPWHQPSGTGAPPPHRRASTWLAWIGLGVAAVAVAVFAVGVRVKLGTGMTGFDSTWYHGPFAAGFAESGHTFQLHFLAPQFLTWFYPQNSELFHSLGILAYGNDLVSPFINLGWICACLLAAWAIGRPYGGSPVSVAGVAIVLASTAMADQSGEARNDMPGTFFLLAALAVLINATAGGRKLSPGALTVVALAAGLAAGTKLNFLAAALAMVIGAVVLSPRVHRLRACAIAVSGLLAGGGYWYLRNLVKSGNPLPWINHIGPLQLPGPAQDVGGREAGSVAHYLGDPGVIWHWFIPGLRDGLGDGWLLLLAIAILAIGLCLVRGSGPARRVGAWVALAMVLAWLVAPTSASGPDGSPTGFVSGLRYLVPALATAMALLGAATGPRGPGWRAGAMLAILVLAPFTIASAADWNLRYLLGAVLMAIVLWTVAVVIRSGYRPGRLRDHAVGPALALVLVVSLGLAVFYPVQRSYFEHRYENSSFSIPGLNGAFNWAQGVSGASIGTNATRQYPFFGRMLGNDVQFIGVPGHEGGFTAPDDCRSFRAAVNQGRYDYLATTLDRIGNRRDFPPEAGWTATDPAATEIYRREPTVIFRLSGPLSPGLCPWSTAWSPPRWNSARR